MKNLLLWAGALALACFSHPAVAQSAAGAAGTGGYAPLSAICTVQPDSTCAAVDASHPVPVTGGAGGSGTDPRVAQGATLAGQTGSLIQCAVVSGDQSYTAATVQPCTLTASGHLKVALSSATNIVPGAAPATTLAADLIACVYRTPVVWTAGWQGAFQCDSAGNLMVSSTTLASAANQTTLIAQTKSLSQAATSTSSNVTAATSSTTLLAANANRLGGAIVNDSTSVLYIKLSATASSTSYDYYLAGSASGVPAQFEIPANWTGAVYGIWVSVNGSARVSERTQ